MNNYTTHSEGSKDLHRDEVIERTINLIYKINDVKLLMRIYRFVQYIYIHKT